MADWQNPCGGTRWRMAPDGIRVELEEEGFAAYEPGTAAFSQLSQTWDNWGDLITDAAQEWEVPPEWILGIMTAETGFLSHDPAAQARAGSPAGARGLMQLMPQYFGGDLTDPAHNVDLGVEFLAELDERTGGQLPLMTANYNAGSLRCSPGRNEWGWVIDDNYTRKVIEGSNAAYQHLDLTPRGSAGEGLLVMPVLAVGAAILLGATLGRAS